MINLPLVFNQIHGHLVSNNLYPVVQSAYRRNHSTETALVKVNYEQYSVKYEQAAHYYPLIVLLDLSAACDTVDHSILLNRLSSKLGLDVIAFDWF